MGRHICRRICEEASEFVKRMMLESQSGSQRAQSDRNASPVHEAGIETSGDEE